MEAIFNNANEPFWRSAKPIELAPIPTEPFAAFLTDRLRSGGREVDPEAVGELLACTGGHPYATQELAYFLWEETPSGDVVSSRRLRFALDAVLRSEHAHFSLLWEDLSAAQKLILQALAVEPGRPYTGEYRQRHNLPATTNVQKALGALERREVIAGDKGAYRIAEPFLGEWIVRQALS
jgi:hypothetical protein